MEGPAIEGGDDPKPMTVKNVPAETRELFTTGATANKETMAQYLTRVMKMAAALDGPTVTGSKEALVGDGECAGGDDRDAALVRILNIAGAVKSLVEADALGRAADPQCVLILGPTNLRAIRGLVADLLRTARGFPPKRRPGSSPPVDEPTPGEVAEG